ncbi:dockerin type I domain-containing protein [Roseivirga misakiensis]|uniref:Dockerin domain-containing protein n=1 Tax=Roseivirga misakiensis TaxID=1563681 RepID=A0A1E5T7U0_9BACT|nr:dockerin type I domain-containing protein [Roseivirga misakiensis]OEK07439.1 hypothetical protein BFP71_00070 [Roseivirga misakiensis]
MMIRNKKWILGFGLYLVGSLSLFSQTDSNDNSSSQGIRLNEVEVAFSSDALYVSPVSEFNIVSDPEEKEISGTILSARDICVFELGADITDQFQFITFVDIAENTVIYFSAVGVNASGVFQAGNTSSSDGTFAYTVPAGGLSAGDIVKWVLGANSPNFSVYTDNISTRTAETNLSSGGESIIVFQKRNAPLGGANALSDPTFISITYTGSTQFGGDPSDTNDTHLPSGLQTSTPVSAMAFGVGPNPSDEYDNVIYNGGFTFNSVDEAKDAFFNTSNYLPSQLNNSSTYITAKNNVPSRITLAVADTDPPTFDVTPSVSSVTSSGFMVGASIDERGDIYYVVVADGATAPTSVNVIAGQANGGGSPIASGNGQGLTDPFTLFSAVTGLTAGTAYDVYVVARDDEGTPNVQSSPIKVDVTTLAPSSLQIAATVFLEGAYNGTNLNTAINSSIPAQQPYNGVNSHSQTTNVSIPANAVDWVLVELREAGTAATATNGTRKGSTAGFLMNDGTIKATDGTSNPTINLTGNTGTDYYVVVYHRNHLPIMSAAAIDGSGGTLTIDFTSNSANTYQTTTALASLTNNKFGMPSGDVNQDGSINSTDLSTWQTNNGAVYSYSGSGIADFNLDGEINAVDRNDFQQKNTSKTRQVPTSTL